LLGWGAEDGKTETFTLAELIPIFSLERVTPSPAIFDFDKLNWLNRHYIKLADPERIAKLAERQFCLQKPASFHCGPRRSSTQRRPSRCSPASIRRSIWISRLPS